MAFLSSHAQNEFRKAVKDTKVNGYFRTYFMQTLNQDSLQDWHSLAVGGKLGFETGRYYGFSAGAAFYASINTGIGNVSTTDPTTGKNSRYELGMYNALNPNEREIYQLGEAYLRYRYKGHAFQVGRFKRMSPLLNHQDGRMIPTLFQGAWYTNTSLKNWRFEVAGINAILPRSTNEWQSIESSLVYPQGLSTEGGKSNYIGNIDSDFIGVAHVKGKLSKKLEVNVWNFYTDNVFNSLYSEITFKDSLGVWGLIAQAQQIHQHKVTNGGATEIITDSGVDPNVGMAYFQDDFSNVYGGRIALLRNGWQFRVNVTHISDEGRFLFPREWGREFLYTFQKRERQDGYRNVTAWVIDLGKQHRFKNKDVLHASVGYGLYNRPEATDAARNKYAMPANSQIDLDLFYHFNGSIPGLTLEGLIVCKRAMGDTYNNPNYVINKVNLINYQLILNYRF